MVVALVGGALALSIALAATGREDADFDDLPISVLTIGQLGQWVGFLGVPWLVTRLKGSGLVTDLRLRFELRDLWVGGGIGVLLQLAVVPLISYPWIWLLGEDSDELEERARLLADRADTAGAAILLVLVVGLGAPLMEEIFYRGLVQGALLKRGLVPAISVVITAAVFAAAHTSVIEFPALFAFGLGVGALAVRSGRLGPSIAAHVTFNLVTVITTLVLE
jgi:membrane protease YdiL (CAAX protease family)